MLFNSIEFALYLPIVFAAYWLIGPQRVRAQNLLIVGASYFFYGWWDWRFLSLIAFSSLIDYFVGMALGRQSLPSRRRLLLGLSIVMNIGFLGFFKYYNFFVASFVDAFSLLGKSIEPGTLSIILPVGISFYTFQTLSYSIDVYHRRLEPCRDGVAFFAYVSFFPQLVAGPIERATQLLPQFAVQRKFDYAKALDGTRQMLWGLFKKIVIADNCAPFVNDIFSHSSSYSGSTLMLGAFLFAFQIYGDFSGYSDIAIGISRLFGFDLMQNFAFPYFSRNIAEFWRRWHISLSTWFRDYLYIPLGGSRGGRWMNLRNIFAIFLVSGFWHGANWTFLAWGAINACLFLPLMLMKKNRQFLDVAAQGRLLPSIREFAQMGITFFLTNIAWVFFRADTIGHAVAYLGGIFTRSWLRVPEVFPQTVLVLIGLLLMVEWVQRERQHGLDLTGRKLPALVRYGLYYGLVALIFYFNGSDQTFIYFQF